MKHQLQCEECKENFLHYSPHAKTCGEVCRKVRAKRLSGRYADTSIPTGTVGAISEIIISVDLMKKGYAVFRSLSQSCFCDIIAIKGKTVLKIEIRTGYKSTSGKICFPTKTHGEIDIYGIYERAGDKCYYFNKELKEIVI